MSAVVAYTAAFIRKPLQQEAERDREKTQTRFSEHGMRIGEAEAAVRENRARIDTADRSTERLHLQMTAMAEQFGRHDSRMERLMAMMEEQERERLTEDRAIGERLARIETRMDVFQELRDALRNLGNQRREA
jgi:chromosome segregation ATPase